MKKLKEYEVSFFGLKEGSHHFEYKVDKQFFEAFNYQDFLDADVLIKVEFIKKSTLMEFKCFAEGTVKLICDISNEIYDQPISGKLDFVVKFGPEFNDDNEDIIIVPHGEHQINIAQYIYEMIVLAVPKKRVHPGIEDGSLKSEIVEKLKELQPKENKSLNKTDPRWDDLKKLLIDKNI